MPWVLAFEVLDHGDKDRGEAWTPALRLIPRAIPLNYAARDNALQEAIECWVTLNADEPFPRRSNPTLRWDEALPEADIAALTLKRTHLEIDELRAAVFRHGDEVPAYTVPWKDEAERIRVTAHLAVCTVCRDMVERERQDNDLYQMVCVERKFTWEEMVESIEADNARATLEHGPSDAKG